MRTAIVSSLLKFSVKRPYQRVINSNLQLSINFHIVIFLIQLIPEKWEKVWERASILLISELYSFI